MDNNKLDTITNLFEEKEIRSIWNSEKEEYKKLHEEIIRYFHFLYQKACDGLSNKELKAWFEFNEVPNNWLGYSMSGNKGAALGKQYARFLYKNIRFATNTNNITKSNHIEKIMLGARI